MKRIVLILALFTQALFAAEHRGIIRYNGLPVPGATVVAAQSEQKLIAVSDIHGVYLFPDLAEGSWIIKVDKLGFEPTTREVKIGPESIAAEFELTMLAMDKIKTEPIPAVFQQTDVAASEENKDAAPVAEAPKQSSFANLSAEQLSERAADGFLINGSVNNGAASPFAQRAAFGNNRRGIRLYNGSINAFLNNSALNARPYSLLGREIPKPDSSNTQLAINFGGLVNIPFLKNSVNSFVSYQRNQDRNARIETGRMPTLLERSGDFSQTRNQLGQAIQIMDPQTGRSFDGNVIQPERISPQAASLLSLYPLPNYESNSGYNYQNPIISTAHQDNIQARMSRYALSVSVNYQSRRSDNSNIFYFLDKEKNSSFNLSSSYYLRPTQRSNMRFGYQFNRSVARITPYFSHRANISGLAGIAGNDQSPENWGPPNLSFSNFTQLTDSKASFDRDQSHLFSVSAQINHKEHNISLGFEFRREQLNSLSQQNARGSYTFTGAAAGYDFADFLLGIPDASSIAFGNADKYFRGSNYAIYINDDFHVNSALTLNGGIRWEYEAPVTELYGRLVNLDIASGFSAVSPVLGNDPKGSITGRKYFSSLIDPDKGGVQPRIGFAWRPAAASSWIIRGGYGLYRDTSVYRNIAIQMAQQSPFSKSLVAGNSPATPLTLANGFTFSPNTAFNNFAIDPKFRVANAQNWQFSIQQDLPFSMQMVATYQGSKGKHLIQRSYPNTYPAGSTNICEKCPSGFLYQSSNGESIRHAGILQLRRRLRHGFSAELRYTFSKSIDDAGLGGMQAAQNWMDIKAERALSNFDQRHLLNLQAQCTPGSGGFRPTLLRGWTGAFLKEWTISWNLTIGSGKPLTPVYSTVATGSGITGIFRPNRTGESMTAATPGLFLNPAAFAAPSPGQWGNAGRNIIVGPKQFGFDASMGRAFRLQDRYNLEFRLSATNTLNHVTYASWNTVTNSSQFGLPSSANPMRKLQANLRFSF